MWDCLLCQQPPGLVLQTLPCCESSLPQLPVSSPPTGLNECFFFISLVVRLPYSSIFCQFWLFFVFKFVVVLLLVVQGGTVCLSTAPSWPELPSLSYVSQLIQTTSDENDFSGYVYGIFSVFSISKVPGNLRAITQSLPSHFSPNFKVWLIHSCLK